MIYCVALHPYIFFAHQKEQQIANCSSLFYLLSKKNDCSFTFFKRMEVQFTLLLLICYFDLCVKGLLKWLILPLFKKAKSELLFCCCKKSDQLRAITSLLYEKKEWTEPFAIKNSKRAYHSAIFEKRNYLRKIA